MTTSKMYCWNYLVSFATFIGFWGISKVFKKIKPIHNKLKSFNFVGNLGFMLIDAHIQFIIFMFFHQMQHPFFYNFYDKINMIFCLLYMFVALFFGFCSYPVFSYLCTKNKFQMAFPLCKKGSKFGYFGVLYLGSIRKIFLGLIQSWHYSYGIQAVLLIMLNFATLKALFNPQISSFLPKKSQEIKKMLYIALQAFLIFSLLKEYVYPYSETLKTFQLISLCSIGVICSFDFIYSLMTIMVSLISETKRFCSG